MSFAILGAAITVVSACEHTNPEAAAANAVSASLEDRLSAIERIANILSDESSNWPYFKNAEVRELYANPLPHIDASKQLWVTPDVPIPVKQLAVRLLQCIPMPEYLHLIESSYSSYKQDLLPVEVMETLVAPGPDWGTQIALNYDDAEVSRVLDLIAQDRKAPEKLRASIEAIRSGNVAAYVQAHNLPAEPLPRMKCPATPHESVSEDSSP